MLKHNALATHKNLLYEIFYNARNGEFTLREFLNAVERTATRLPDDVDVRNKYKGDAFEVLAEIFFTLFQHDASVGLANYTPVPIEQDYGVDASGRNPAGEDVVVQVKYRHNPSDLVLYEEIAKTDASGRRLLHYNLDRPRCIYVFTTAIGVTPACQRVYGNHIYLLNIDIIGDYIRNNLNFWEDAFRLVYEYLNP